MSYIKKYCLTAALLAASSLLSLRPASADEAKPKPSGATFVMGADGNPSALNVPGYIAYVYPDRDALDLSPESGTPDWTDAKQSLVWYGDIKTAGTLHPTIALRLPAGEQVTLRLTVTPGGVDNPASSAARTFTATVTGTGADNDATADFGTIPVTRTGYTRFTLEGVKRTGKTFGNVTALRLTGDAIKDAHFPASANRGAASVHLFYPVPPDLGPVNAAYEEVTARLEPITTYYCALGWNRGYFGYQVNSPTERRIIFSVWDASSEPTDPAKVATDDRVQLLAKGDGVFAGRFGNEGTGGHSHLVYPWKTGGTYRFLVTSQQDGPTHAIYAGYFYFPEKQAWGLIAKFRAPIRPNPKTGVLPTSQLLGLYSFDEDFWGNNGDQRREAEFGNQWVHTADGKWHELTDAVFTGGEKSRVDMASGPTGDGSAFTLATGGFLAPKTPIHERDTLHRTALGKLPKDLDSLLASPPVGVAASQAANGAPPKP